MKKMEDVEVQEEFEQPLDMKGWTFLNKEAEEGIGKRRCILSSKMPSTPPVTALTMSDLHYAHAGCRNKQQVCYNGHIGSVYTKYTFHFSFICFRKSVLRIG